MKRAEAYRLAGSIMIGLLYNEIPEQIPMSGEKSLLKSYEAEMASIHKRVSYGLSQQKSDALKPRAEFLMTTLLAGVSAVNRLEKKLAGDTASLKPVLETLKDFALVEQEYWVYFGCLMLRASYLVEQNWPLVQSVAEKLNKAESDTVSTASLLSDNVASGKTEGSR